MIPRKYWKFRHVFVDHRQIIGDHQRGVHRSAAWHDWSKATFVANQLEFWLEKANRERQRRDEVSRLVLNQATAATEVTTQNVFFAGTLCHRGFDAASIHDNFFWWNAE